MKKHGFTLAELLISFGIIGIIAALCGVYASKARPDVMKVTYLKHYNAIAKSVKNAAYSMKDEGKEISVDGKNISINYNKIPFYNVDDGNNIFAAKLADAISASDIKSGLKDETTYDTTTINNIKDGKFPATPSFKKNGVEYFVTSHYEKPTKTSDGKYKGKYYSDIYFKIPRKDKGADCMYNETTCKEPNIFGLRVDASGHIYNTDKKGLYYNQTSRDWFWRGKAKSNNAQNYSLSDTLDWSIIVPIANPESGCSEDIVKACNNKKGILQEDCSCPCKEDEIEENGVCTAKNGGGKDDDDDDDTPDDTPDDTSECKAPRSNDIYVYAILNLDEIDGVHPSQIKLDIYQEIHKNYKNDCSVIYQIYGYGVNDVRDLYFYTKKAGEPKKISYEGRYPQVSVDNFPRGYSADPYFTLENLLTLYGGHGTLKLYVNGMMKNTLSLNYVITGDFGSYYNDLIQHEQDFYNDLYPLLTNEITYPNIEQGGIIDNTTIACSYAYKLNKSNLQWELADKYNREGKESYCEFYNNRYAKNFDSIWTRYKSLNINIEYPNIDGNQSIDDDGYYSLNYYVDGFKEYLIKDTSKNKFNFINF